jgi:hypothetical protein
MTTELQDAQRGLCDVRFAGNLPEVAAAIGSLLCHGRSRGTLGQYP